LHQVVVPTRFDPHDWGPACHHVKAKPRSVDAVARPLANIVHRLSEPVFTLENRFYRWQQLVEDFCLYDVTVCPKRRASCTKSAEDSTLAMIIFDLGDSVRMRRVASSPLSFGILMSSRIKSGCSSAALRTASNPSEASATTSKSGRFLSIEQIASRRPAKSPTTNTRATDTLNEYRHTESLRGSPTRDFPAYVTKSLSRSSRVWL
jgi:hypothetical protein